MNNTWDSDAIATVQSITIGGKSVTAPAAAGPMSVTTGTETLTGKTLTSPVLNTPSTSGLTVSVGNALTAAGTTVTDALALTADVNNITTATASTGVKLPLGTVGRLVVIFNGGASAIKVYGSGSDTIDTQAAATGVTLTNAKRCAYYCVAAATWISAQLGVVSA